MAELFFQQQLDYIFFLYGFVFILLAAICATMRRDRTQRLPWIWLGLFSLAHGLNKLLEILAQGLGDGPAFMAFRLCLLVLAFVFLIEFGRVGLHRLQGKGPGRWIYIPLLVLIIASAFVGVAALNAAARYVLELPGGVLAALALYRAGRQGQSPRRALSFAAFFMACNAIVAGTIVPKAAFFPASVFNRDFFVSLTGIPVQAISTLLVILITAALWLNFQKIHQSLIPEVKQKSIGLSFVITLAIVLAVGWTFTEYVGKSKDKEVRDEIRKQTLLAASAVNRRRVRSLTGTEPDLNHPDYLRLREQLMQIGGTNPHFRTAYLMLLREGKIIIEVDSVPEGASGHGDPGEVRKPLPKEIFSVFTTGRGTIVGPYTDETGTFISGFEAIRDFSTNQIVGALGIDLAAGVWKVSIAGSRLVPICITMLLAFIIIGFFMARQQLWESAQTISASEKRLTSAQRIAHIGSWTLDTRTNQVTWSEEMDRIFRRVLRAEELVYSDILIFIHPEDREKLAETMQRAISEGVGFELELRIIRADGSVGYGISKAEVKLGGGAEVIQVVGTMEDITERRLAESALRESEEQFRAMSAAAQDAVIMMDNDGLITFWSEAAERIFGRSRNETVGKSTHDLLAPAVYREEFQKVFPQWRETGQGAAVGKTVELIALRKDGTEFPVEISLSSPRLKGRWNAIAIIRDITALKQAEEALKESEQKFRTIFDKANDGMFLVDLETRKFLMCNAMCLHMLGYDQEEFLNLEISDIHPKDDLPLVFEQIANFMKGEEGVRHDLRFRRKDGSFLFSDLSPALVTLAGRKVILIVCKDITERKKIEEEKRQANEKLSSMVKKLKERSLQNSVLSEMREFLQACSTMEEIGPIILRSMKKLFPDSAGTLFLLSASKTDLESAVRWGDFPEDVDNNVFPPDACWGLRRGSVYMVDDIKSGLICPHLKHPPATAYACLPLMAKGDVLGLLHIRGQSTGKGEDSLRLISDLKDLTTTLSELLSLSISNIKLREILSIQSIKDPLTGLFNRRYMEENFQREIYRAARKRDQIGVIMVDIDHFKNFNDLYGHAAGDFVLVELANFFKIRIRGADIACRYGGEEFAFILPESSLENTVKRASQMIEEARTLKVQYGGQVLGPTTLSMGVSAYPIHGAKPEDLLRAADAALYRAKKEGRDRVISA